MFEPYDKIIVASLEEAQQVVDKLSKEPIISLDTETNSLHWHSSNRADKKAYMCGVCFGTHSAGYYFPTRCRRMEDKNKSLPYKPLMEIIKPLIENPKIKKILHNKRFDEHFLYNEGIKIKGRTYDTLDIDKILNLQDKGHSLKTLVIKYKLMPDVKTKDQIDIWRAEYARKNHRRKRAVSKIKDVTYDYIPISIIGPYGCDDAVYTFRLWEKLWEDLNKKKRLLVIEEKEYLLSKVLFDMERRGVYVNLQHLEKYRAEIQTELDALQDDVNRTFGFRVDLNSNIVKQGLFKLLDMDVSDKEGKPTARRQSIVKAQKKYKEPGLAKIVRYSEMTKLISTYILGIPQRALNGKVHSSYNAMVATGRMSSRDPNLQNIPGKTEEGKMIRKAFYPPDGHIMLSIDLSQIEMRVAAHLSQDRQLLEAYRNDKDLHTLTASLAIMKSFNDVTPTERKVGKTLNFAMMFGSGPDTLTDQLAEAGVKSTPSYSLKLIENFWVGYSGLAAYRKKIFKMARQNGFIYNFYGRYRPVPDAMITNELKRGLRARAERSALSHAIQGTAADILKKAMIRIHAYLKKEKLKTRMVMPIHDELIFYLHNSEFHIVPELQRRMETFSEMSIPIKSSIAASDISWGHKEDMTYEQLCERFKK